MFRFCIQCNSMLYPKEDRVNQQLLYGCRNCNYMEHSDDPLIYRNVLITNASDTAGETFDLAADVTLPRCKKECPACHANECVFFQSQERRAETTMALFYVCVNCGRMFQDQDVLSRQHEIA